ncbi:rCG32747 [Rattus norvegicus]|uniref:RCG32747 n=1 Tax=Rattus norvegicus TaxID=10116 RepID=A6HL16_RAT|nr:rCG32747 [Rattus norvegicus]
METSPCRLPHHFASNFSRLLGSPGVSSAGAGRWRKDRCVDSSCSHVPCPFCHAEQFHPDAAGEPSELYSKSMSLA